MSYTAPRTWVVGEALTAALLNTHLRDNMIFIATPSMARVTSGTAQSIANDGNFYSLTLGSEIIDTDTMYGTANPTRLTCKTAGYYDIDGGAAIASDATGYRQGRIVLNGSVEIGTDVRSAANGVSTTVNPRVRNYSLAVNDYVEFQVRHNGSGALNVNAAPQYSPVFTIRLVSA